MNVWTHQWDERVDGERTIRTTTYLNHRLEVIAQTVGTSGDFAAIVVQIAPHRATERSQPYWGKSATEALEIACIAALRQVQADQ
ncbi:hypothetical protein D9M72_654420 [compost metagenome]